MITDHPVIKRGDVYKVYCHKSGEFTLLVNCAECECNRGYNGKTLKCEQK